MSNSQLNNKELSDSRNFDGSKVTKTELCQLINDIIKSEDGVLSEDNVNLLIQFFCTFYLGHNVGKTVLKAIAPYLKPNNVNPLMKWLLSHPTSGFSQMIIKMFKEAVEKEGRESPLLNKMWNFHTTLHFLLGKQNANDGPLCSLLEVMYHPKLVTPFIINITKSRKVNANMFNVQKLLKKYELKDIPENSEKRMILKSQNTTYIRNLQVESKMKSVFVAGVSRCVPHEDKDIVHLSELTNMQELGRSFGKIEDWCGWWSRFGIAWASTLPSDHLPTTLPPFPSPPTSVVTWAQAPLPSPPTSFSNFLKVWDGLQQQEDVYKLIGWIDFDTIPELKMNFLSPLFSVFSTSLVKEKCKIIRALGRFLTNFVSVSLERAKKNYEIPFHKNMPKWFADPFRTYETIVELILKFIYFGVIADNFSSLILMEALIFYRMVASLEVIFSVPVITLAPTKLIFSCLVSHQPSVIDQLCSLLLRYEKVNIPHAIPMGIVKEDGPELESFFSICLELYKFLWTGEEGDGMMTIKTHPAFAPMKLFFAENRIKEEEFSDEQWLVLLRGYSESVADFIESVRS